MSPLSLWVLIFLAGLGIGSTGAWKAQGWRFKAAEAERIEAEGRALLRRQDNALEASQRFQTTQAESETREREVIKEVIRVVQKPVYREQCLDDDGMRILASDVQTANARRGLSPAVPAASAPK